MHKLELCLIELPELIFSLSESSFSYDYDLWNSRDPLGDAFLRDPFTEVLFGNIICESLPFAVGASFVRLV